jgi:pimeloyl-ACP methyl ester carboxylesterase
MRRIKEAGFLKLNGLDQWVMIRGEDAANPPLVMLHGGPGMPETGFFRRYNRALEKDFTVVYWEQRGAGRSFRPGIPAATMTVEQFISDLDALIDAVRLRLATEQVVLFGHSWGSALGVLYAARFPEKVALYVGSGQLGDWPASERAAWRFTVNEAERRHKRKAIDQLARVGPPPHDGAQLWTQRMWLSRFAGEAGLRRLINMLASGLLLQLPRFLNGMRFSLNALWPEVSRMDLTKRVPELKMPVILIEGRHDRFVDPAIKAGFFDAVKAPSKKLIWFEHSGHEPFLDEPRHFNEVMARVVRPEARTGAQRAAA